MRKKKYTIKILKWTGFSVNDWVNIQLGPIVLFQFSIINLQINIHQVFSKKYFKKISIMNNKLFLDEKETESNL